VTLWSPPLSNTRGTVWEVEFVPVVPLSSTLDWALWWLAMGIMFATLTVGAVTWWRRRHRLAVTRFGGVLELL